MGSDPDLNMKLWQNGVRVFKGLSNFKVYHFELIFKKKKNLSVNNGTKTFKNGKLLPLSLLNIIYEAVYFLIIKLFVNHIMVL